MGKKRCVVRVGKKRCLGEKWYPTTTLHYSSLSLLSSLSLSTLPSLPLPLTSLPLPLIIGWDKVMRGINDALDVGLGTVKVSCMTQYIS